MTKPLKVALVGLGTVGGGTFSVLKDNAAEIERRVGFPIQIAVVADLNAERARQVAGEGVDISSDAFEVVNRPDVDVVVELIGGYTVAKQLVLAAIAAGKHVVTANKALLAVHGEEIFAAAEKNHVMVGFEAAVAGGIPIIKAIKEGLAANQIEYVAGIINGTCNFILSEMRDKGLPFAEVLSQAQALGYAEADPTFDIEGVDAAHKITLLSALAFGIPVQFDKAYIEGITKLTKEDIEFAEQLGYRVKLLGITRRTDKGVELRVHPTLIPAKRLIANVEGVMNAVLVKANAVGPTLYYGAGAGSLPTASAVVADIIEIARASQVPLESRVPVMAFKTSGVDQNVCMLGMSEVVTAFYLRLTVADKPGVLADVTRILANQNISIEAMIQRQAEDESGQADIVLLTHRCIEGDFNAAMVEIEALDAVVEPMVRVRVEDLS
ncbi:homoserine dehydrogenase [Limnobacter litoralis]|uniref:Homoserine dehydrogenase n=1 Tax=Limnobacter litoralis TaxID=481366 RepID=A0ABQ5YMC8_9BURK|nr:homoserine dehydrogenase [Limnobacter litoralis]GLR25748.1 homoserine dehydrogenase [Limnobacter litoralis]